MDVSSATRSVYVYALSDPNTGDVRYIGKTQNPKQRLRAHYSQARKEAFLHKSRWIRKLLAQGGQPVMSVLEVCVDHAAASEVEKRLIAAYRAQGAPLTNGSAGGEVGEWSRESSAWQRKESLWRKRVGAASRAMWQDPAYRERALALYRSPEYRQKMAVAQRARMQRDGKHTWLDVFGGADPAAMAAARRAAVRLYLDSPEGHAMRAALSKRLWEDPEYRAKMKAERRARGAAGTAAARAALARALDEDPSVRARLGWSRGRKKSPEHIAKVVAATKATKAAKRALASTSSTT